MFKSLIKRFKDANADLLITARDFDSTFQVLDDFGLSYIKIGKHGGAKLEDKLEAYIFRLQALFGVVQKYRPDFFVTFSSVEGPRISFGLRIPSIGINDEPRNESVCKLIFPFLDYIITPKCVPITLYENLCGRREKIIQYNGIDEIAWLTDFEPNAETLKKFGVEKGKYILIRSEMSSASYFIDKLKPEKTLISDFVPSLYNKYPDFKYFLIVRSKEQENWLKEKLADLNLQDNIEITRYLPNLVDLCFYSALVISGGGTIVRESSLLGVPSIEFFPGETAPQEKFLAENGFPLYHVKKPEDILSKAEEILDSKSVIRHFNLSFKKKINRYENPNEILFSKVKNMLSNQK